MNANRDPSSDRRAETTVTAGSSKRTRFSPVSGRSIESATRDRVPLADTITVRPSADALHPPTGAAGASHSAASTGPRLLLRSISHRRV